LDSSCRKALLSVVRANNASEQSSSTASAADVNGSNSTRQRSDPDCGKVLPQMDAAGPHPVFVTIRHTAPLPVKIAFGFWEKSPMNRSTASKKRHQHGSG
jgi:hypothetical protein